MSFMRGDLLHRVSKLVKGGAMERPSWLNAVILVPPQPKDLRCKRPPKIEYPEDPLIESYYARHPEAKMVPFSLQSFDAPIARRFALRQMQLIEEGLSRREARNRTEAEFKAEEEKLEAETARLRRVALREGRNVGRAKSILEQVQEEETQFIAQGLEKMAQRKKATFGTQ